MGRKTKYSKELKIEVVKRNLKGMTPNEVRYHANCNFIYF